MIFILCQIIQCSTALNLGLVNSAGMNFSRTETGLGRPGFPIVPSGASNFSLREDLGENPDCVTVCDSTSDIP